MKKLALIIAVLGGLFLNSLKAEEKGYSFFQEESPSNEELAAYNEYQTMDTDPGSPGDNTSPIDEYLPVLLLSGAILIIMVAKRKNKFAEQ